MRRVGSSGVNTERAIREAGLNLIVRHGYEGMTLRQLASEVGIQAGSLYNHIATKQQLLFDLVIQHMEDLLAALDAALAGLEDPARQLAAFCEFHVRYHIKRKAEVFVINFELRSLDPENRVQVVALRTRYENRLIEIIRRGQQAGVFRGMDAPVAAYGLISMLTGVCTWYSEDGRMGADEIVDLYTAMAFKGVAKA